MSSWRARAACAKVGTTIFFPTDNSQVGKAKAICRSCPVMLDCADAGKKEPFGIWGGLEANQRGYIAGGRRDVPQGDGEWPRPVDLSDSDDLLAWLAGALDRPVGELTGPSGVQGLAVDRHVAMTVVRLVTESSYTTIGRLFRRDHTTVVSAVRNCLAIPGLRSKVDRLVDQARSLAVSAPTY